MNVNEMYDQKLVSPAEAVKVIKSGDLIYTPSEGNEPCILWEALADRKEELENVVVRQFLTRRKHRYVEPSFAPHIFIESLFVTDAIRNLVHDGYASYVPSNFSDIPRMIRQTNHVDVLMLSATPMDEYGYMCYGLGCDYTLAAIEVAKKIIVEVNPNMPWTGGYNKIHVSQVDLIVESNAELYELQPPQVTELDEKIGSYIVDLIDEGSTLQIGIGGIPAAVCKFLEHKKDLGIHTELISDYLVGLLESGAVNGSKKTIHKGKVVCTIIEGTKRFFKYINNHPSIELLPVDYTNDQHIIAQNRKMVSINATIEVDIFGQCCSESIGTKIWGGSGGQSDFARGVTKCPDGKGFIVMKSTAKGGKVSKVVSRLTSGAIVTTGMNYVDHVVTEYGVAKLRHKSMRQRALEMIKIAHPGFREQLQFEAQQMKII